MHLFHWSLAATNQCLSMEAGIIHYFLQGRDGASSSPTKNNKLLLEVIFMYVEPTLEWVKKHLDSFLFPDIIQETNTVYTPTVLHQL